MKGSVDGERTILCYARSFVPHFEQNAGFIAFPRYPSQAGQRQFLIENST